VKKSVGILTVLLVLALGLAACGPAASDVGQALEETGQPTDSSLDEGSQAVATVEPAASVLTLEALQNAEYQTDWTDTGKVKLENGEHREPAAPGSASEIVVGLTEYVASGELNGQPVAAVILYSSGGGSGTFYELHLMVEREGQPYDVAWTDLGDRVQVNSLALQDDQIVVDMIAHGPDDPLCCPTQHVVQTYTLQGDELVQTSG